MIRMSLSVVVGLLSPFVFILGASPFEVRGENSLREIIAGAVAVLVYCAICEFWIVGRMARPPRARWLLPATTVLSLCAASVLLVVESGRGAWTLSALPILISGCFGVGAAVLIRSRHPRAARPPGAG